VCVCVCVCVGGGCVGVWVCGCVDVWKRLCVHKGTNVACIARYTVIIPLVKTHPVNSLSFWPIPVQSTHIHINGQIVPSP